MLLNAWEWVVLIFVIFGILYAFEIPDSVTLNRDDWRFWLRRILKIFTFVPMIIFGIVLHVAGDFKNHKLGYIVIVLVISFVVFGFVMGMRAGTDGPGPWQ